MKATNQYRVLVPVAVTAICWCLSAVGLANESGATDTAGRASSGEQAANHGYEIRLVEESNSAVQLHLWKSDADDPSGAKMFAKLELPNFAWDITRPPEVANVFSEGDEIGLLVREDISRSYTGGEDPGGIFHYIYTYYLLSLNPRESLRKEGFLPTPRIERDENPAKVLVAKSLPGLRNESHTEKWPWEIRLESPRRLIATREQDGRPVERSVEFHLDRMEWDGEKGPVRGLYPGMRSDFVVGYTPEDARMLVAKLASPDFSPVRHSSLDSDDAQPTRILWLRDNVFGGVEGFTEFFRPLATDEAEFERFIAMMGRIEEEHEKEQARRHEANLRFQEERRREEEERRMERMKREEEYLQKVIQEKEETRRAREQRRRQLEAEDAE